MKVVAMAGGLGSQMFKYAFYLNIKITITMNAILTQHHMTR